MLLSSDFDGREITQAEMLTLAGLFSTAEEYMRRKLLSAARLSLYRHGFSLTSADGQRVTVRLEENGLSIITERP